MFKIDSFCCFGVLLNVMPTLAGDFAALNSKLTFT